MENRENIQQKLKNFDLNNMDTRIISFLALFIAFTAVATYLHIPGPSSSYFNLGEVAIYTIALTFGAKAGGIAGGVGSALMDLILGYSIWAPFTFVIKGLEGYVVGKIAHKEKESRFNRNILAIAAGGTIMIIGYALTKAYLLSWAFVPPEIVIDLAQMITGGVVAIPLSHHLNNYFRK
ncbi:ECF transporter S component [Halanaerobium hydrogeniformans]|uniref:Membrane protein n=1 Tax=Halanaerobium hydrogeniformans TaxID=656519 RepID=E4RJJ7_HALHG|nr:ECF transporter S component [Halanaerobium hydrogeniformans]ADQ15417.1 membrane protein [Halanaerobium hydrogeniformans]